MLTAEGCTARRKRLWDALPAPCDLVIIGAPEHVTYLSGYAPSPFTFRTNEDRALLVLRPDRATLVADNILEPFTQQAHVDRVHAPTWYNGKRSAPYRRSLLVSSTVEALRALPGLRIGVEPSAVPQGLVKELRAARPGLELMDIEPILCRMRRAKDPDEVATLRRSMAAAEAGFAAALAGLRPGLSELEVFLLVQRAALEAAGDKALVYGDFDSGPRGNKPASPAQRMVHAGDLFILDFSVVIDGYRGDFANTMVAGGSPTARQQELYEGCLAAMQAGEALLRPGTLAREIDAALRAEFARRGLDPHFDSHSGHGIGLGHPEPPYIVPESNDVLVAGDVVTLEPGQYPADLGGLRFERNYLITASGFETLTHHRLALVP